MDLTTILVQGSEQQVFEVYADKTKEQTIGYTYTEADGRRLESAAKHREEARTLSRQIAAFDRRCSREEYTDTDEAWELLNGARKLLRRMGK